MKITLAEIKQMVREELRNVKRSRKINETRMPMQMSESDPVMMALGNKVFKAKVNKVLQLLGIDPYDCNATPDDLVAFEVLMCKDLSMQGSGNHCKNILNGLKMELGSMDSVLMSLCDGVTV